ncbi:hypothetical protein Tco_0969328 [Tanacetum coccineum]
METDEVSKRYIAPCFVNGLEAYDGKINLALDENLISNEYAMKLSLDYEVMKGNKVVKKELIVALKGEIYFVKFIINPKEDDVEPGVIFGRSFMRLVNVIVDFGSGAITVYPEHDPFEDDSEKTEKSMDDWDQHLTQEEAAKEALALRISQKFALLEEVRPVLKIIAYNDKYKKLLDEIWKDKVELDGMIVKEDEEAINKVKGEALKEKDDPKHLLWEETMMKSDHQDPNALDNTKPWKRYCFHNFIMNSYYGKVATKRQSLVCADDELQTKKFIKSRLGGRAHSLTLLEFARRLGLYHADKVDEEGFDVYFQGGLCSDDHFNVHEYWLSISREENLSLSRSHVSNNRSLVLRVIQKMITYGLCQRTTGYDKIQKNDFWLLSMFDARHQNGYANVAWLIARWMKRKGAGIQEESQICYGQFIIKISIKARVLSDVVIRSLSAPIYCRDLDTTIVRELIDSEGRLIHKDPQPGVPRVAIPRPPRASMQDLYDRMCNMEIRQGAIERISYKQSYH